MELVKLLSNIVKENYKTKKILLEYPESTIKKLVDKFSGQTEDSIDVIKNTIADFERFKGTFDNADKDIFRHSYDKVKELVKSKSESQKSKKTFDDVYITFMQNNPGADKRLTKFNIKKYFEMKALDPKRFRKDILTMTSIELSALIRRDFENFMKEKLTEKLLKENPQENIEQVINRVDRYVANYNLVPLNTKPAGMMNFVEFEHVVDVLPMQDEYKVPEVDVSDVNVVFEDDNILIFLPDQKHKCINIRKKYAPDRRWCTSWEGSSNYYYNYRLRQNLTLYYVINKNLKESDVNFAVVVLVDYDWRKNVQFRLADGTNSGRFAGSTIMPWSEIIQKIPNLKGREGYFIPHPFPPDQQELLMSFERKNVESNAIKELGSEENVELWLELRTPDLSTARNGDEIWRSLTPYLKHKYIGMDGKLTGQMLKDSDKESKEYYLSKKRKALLLTDIDKLTEADISLITSDEMLPYTDALIATYSKQLSKKNLDLSYLPIVFPADAAAKFAMMFGLDTLFDILPEDTQFINLENKSDKVKPFDVPKNISKFKNLRTFVADNIIKSLPENIGECKMLSFLNVTGNKELKTLPKSLSNLYCLTFVSVLDSGIDVDNLPKELFKYMMPTEDFFIVNFPEELKIKRGCKSEF